MKDKLHKSRKNKMVLGVCGGIAEYFDLDSSLVRILWTIGSLFYGAGVFIYLVAAFILPYDEEDKEKQLNNWEDKHLKKEEQKKVIGVLLIFIGALLIFKNFFYMFDFDILWSLILIALGILVIYKGRENKDEE